MQLEIAKPRPPYVMFEQRPEEDRNASIAAGHAKFTNVDYAIITPAGSKDRVERPISAWFAHLEAEVRSERFPAEWLQNFKAQYAAWKEGRELPLDGTPILSWPVATPAQVKELLGLRLRTVEDLAAANEETVRRLGMGGRALKQQAVEWLAASKDIGQVSSRITALEIRNAEQAKMISELVAANERLLAQLSAFAPAAKAAVAEDD